VALPLAWQASGSCSLAPGWCLSQARQGSIHSTWSWSQAGPDGRGGGLFVPRVAGAQQGLKGSGLGEGRAVGLAPGWGPAQTDSGDPGGRGSGGMAKGRVFRRGVGLKAGGPRG
jgi:hypothetical protein